MTATSRSNGVLVPALALTVMVVAVLQSLVVPVLGAIAASLGESSAAVGWLVTANLLAAAVLTPLLGRIGDLHGRRPVLLGVLVVVAAGSLLAAVSSSLPLLIVGRVLQGASFGLFPLSMGVLRDELPPERLTGAMAVVSGALGVGGGIGLVLAGVLTRGDADYRRVFWMALLVTLVALGVTALTVPTRRHDIAGRVDWLGAALLGAGLVLLLLPLSKGHEWGWGSARTLGSLAAAGGVFALWVAVERRVAAPLVAPALMTSRPLLVTNAAGLFVGLAMFVSFLGVSAFVQTPAEAGYGFGASVLATASLYMLPGALLGVVAAPISGRLVRRYGGRMTLLLAALVGAVGFGVLTVLHTASWHVITGSLLVSAAVTAAYAAMPALIVDEVAPHETGVANSVNSIARTVGGSLASAVVVTLLASWVLPSGLPRESAYVTAFALGAAGCLLAALVVTIGLPRRRDLEAAPVAAAPRPALAQAA